MGSGVKVVVTTDPPELTIPSPAQMFAIGTGGSIVEFTEDECGLRMPSRMPGGVAVSDIGGLR